nr:hypothetical protein [Verrucomicrobiota bacterium]
HFSQEAPQVFADLSKNLWDQKTEALLLDMASACGLTQRRDAMLAGQRSGNTTASAGPRQLQRWPPGREFPYRIFPPQNTGFTGYPFWRGGRMLWHNHE